MRWMRPYCQSNTAAKPQAPVKIIQRNSGAPSGVAAAASRAGEKAMTLIPNVSSRPNLCERHRVRVFRLGRRASEPSSLTTSTHGPQPTRPVLGNFLELMEIYAPAVGFGENPSRADNSGVGRQAGLRLARGIVLSRLAPERRLRR